MGTRDDTSIGPPERVCKYSNGVRGESDFWIGLKTNA
jgi:hypothetical protein